MNIIEAAKAMEDGSKIRCPTWRNHEYLRKHDNLIVDETGEEYALAHSDILATDWEIVQ